MLSCLVLTRLQDDLGGGIGEDSPYPDYVAASLDLCSRQNTTNSQRRILDSYGQYDCV